MKRSKGTKDQHGKAPGLNPSPIGTQANPVSDPAREEPNVVEKELEARRKSQDEQARKAKER